MLRPAIAVFKSSRRKFATLGSREDRLKCMLYRRPTPGGFQRRDWAYFFGLCLSSQSCNREPAKGGEYK